MAGPDRHIGKLFYLGVGIIVGLGSAAAFFRLWYVTVSAYAAAMVGVYVLAHFRPEFSEVRASQGEMLLFFVLIEVAMWVVILAILIMAAVM